MLTIPIISFPHNFLISNKVTDYEIHKTSHAFWKRWASLYSIPLLKYWTADPVLSLSGPYRFCDEWQFISVSEDTPATRWRVAGRLSKGGAPWGVLKKRGGGTVDQRTKEDENWQVEGDSSKGNASWEGHSKLKWRNYPSLSRDG